MDEPGPSGQYANVNLGLNNDTPSSSSGAAPEPSDAVQTSAVQTSVVQTSEENSDQSTKTEPLTPQQQLQQQRHERLERRRRLHIRSHIHNDATLPPLFTIFFGGENVLYNITNSKKTLTNFRNTARVLSDLRRPRIRLVLWTTYTTAQIQHLTRKYPQLLTDFDEILGDQYNNDTLQHPGVIAKIINRHNQARPDETPPFANRYQAHPTDRATLQYIDNRNTTPFSDIITTTPVRHQGNVLRYLIVDDKIEKIDSNPEINRLVWDSNKILNVSYDYEINPQLEQRRRTRGDHYKQSGDLARDIHNKVNLICPNFLGSAV